MYALTWCVESFQFGVRESKTDDSGFDSVFGVSYRPEVG
jgi:hypothetical protein